MTFWDWANGHPVALGIMVILALLILDSMVTNVARALASRSK